MKTNNVLPNLAVLVAFLGPFFASLSVRADEGFWTFDNLPTQKIHENYGFALKPELARRLMMGTVRLNTGGTGAFVSAQGLILTNHHVAADTIEKASSSDHDYLQNGFYAETLEKEIKAADLIVDVLIDIKDVTARVNKAMAQAKDLADSTRLRKLEINKIEAEARAQNNLKNEVVTLYKGGQYSLYTYKSYTDVRIVFAPESNIAAFGGDPDNFEFPRYDLDISFLRVYENGKPAQVDNFFKLTKQLNFKDLLFVSGHPGRTNRSWTYADLLWYQKEILPNIINKIKTSLNAFQTFSKKSEESRRQAEGLILGYQNALKVFKGEAAALNKASIWKTKKESEKTLLSKVPSLAQPINQISSVLESTKTLAREYAEFEKSVGLGSQLLYLARTLLRYRTELKKPDQDRLQEYTEANREKLNQALFSSAPIYSELEKVKLTVSLSGILSSLGQNHPLVKKLLGGKSISDRVDELISGTHLSQVDERRRLMTLSESEFLQSSDSAIQLAIQIDQESRQIRKDWEEKINEPKTLAYAEIAKAQFHGVSEGQQYPDATFSLRLSYGKSAGYFEGADFIPPATKIGGAFAHEKKHGAKDPWQLPESWKKNQDHLDLNAVFNFVLTTDIIGGNSGSPILNKNGEYVGIIFDGNRHSHIANFAYEEEQNRALGVSSQAILETLENVYKAERVLQEIECQKDSFRNNNKSIRD